MKNIGLTNGATGWIREIQWINKKNEKRRENVASDIRVIYVEFDDPIVGDGYAKTHKYKHARNATWIPITPLEVQYFYHRQPQARLQLPIVLAYGIT